MKILITGASGFVGTALSENLKSHNVHLCLVKHQRAIAHQDDSDFVKADLSEEFDWSTILQGCDIVVHLAARVHIMQDSSIDPFAEYYRTNVLGTKKLAIQAAAAGIKRFIFLSTVKVNGEKTFDCPFTEAQSVSPEDAYALSKWKAEQALLELSQNADMEVVIIRPPLVYGPGVKANFLSLLNLVYKTLPLPFGSIQNKRSMIYVENLVSALILCATHPNAAGQIYVVCDDENVSTPDLLRKLALAMHKPYRVFSLPVGLLRFATRLVRKQAVINKLSQSLEIDCSKIKQDLNWQPPFTLQQGLQKTVDWYLQTKQGNKF